MKSSSNKSTVTCVEPFPDLSKYEGKIIPIRESRKQFKTKFRQWIPYHNKKERLGGYVCKKNKSDYCVTEFSERQTKETLKKSHYSEHQNNKDAFRQVSKFIFVSKDCAMSDGSSKQMMFIVGEIRIQQMQQFGFKVLKTDKNKKKKINSNQSNTHNHQDRSETIDNKINDMGDNDNVKNNNDLSNYNIQSAKNEEMDIQSSNIKVSNSQTNNLNVNVNKLNENNLNNSSNMVSISQTTLNSLQSALSVIPAMQQQIQKLMESHGKKSDQSQQLPKNQSSLDKFLYNPNNHSKSKSVSVEQKLASKTPKRIFNKFTQPLASEFDWMSLYGLTPNEMMLNAMVKRYWYFIFTKDRILKLCKQCREYYRCSTTRSTTTECCKTHSIKIDKDKMDDIVTGAMLINKYTKHIRQASHTRDEIAYGNQDTIARNETYLQVIDVVSQHQHH